MLELYKASIVMKVITPTEDGKFKEARVTLANVRTDLTTTEMKQLINAFKTLIPYQVSEAQLLQYSHII